MRTMKKQLLTLLIIMVALFTAEAQTSDPNTAEIKIKTSATCGMCKETIEKYMAFEKGVKRSDLDVASKVLTVTYNPKKTSPEKIRLAVSKSGYDADDVKADPKAYNKLEDCCKKGKVCNDK
jgi:mercuric ion binding protein